MASTEGPSIEQRLKRAGVEGPFHLNLLCESRTFVIFQMRQKLTTELSKFCGFIIQSKGGENDMIFLDLDEAINLSALFDKRIAMARGRA